MRCSDCTSFQPDAFIAGSGTCIRWVSDPSQPFDIGEARTPNGNSVGAEFGCVLFERVGSGGIITTRGGKV